jgi:translation initiation factor IF-1
MVKNLRGGSKTKCQGRKFVNGSTSTALRVSIDEECEFYACVTRVNGCRKFQVITIDGKVFCMAVSNKFKQPQYKVEVNSIVLITPRGFSNDTKCDMLALYSTQDVNFLRSTPSTNIHKLDKYTTRSYGDIDDSYLRFSDKDAHENNGLNREANDCDTKDNNKELEPELELELELDININDI